MLARKNRRKGRKKKRKKVRLRGRCPNRVQNQLASQPESMLRGGVLPAAYNGAADPAPGTGRPGARVYHMDGDGMSVVMIVDESLDV